MVTILVLYYSQTGVNRGLAEACAAGVEEMVDARCLLRDAREATLQDLLGCDALAIGSPEYFGYMSGALKGFFDRTYEAAREQVLRKPYAVFVNGGNDGSGALQSIERICLGYRFRRVQESLVVKGEPSSADLERCRELGQTLAAGCSAGIW